MQFINSAKIRIYTTPYRGSGYDPEARLKTEESDARVYKAFNTYRGGGSFLLTNPASWTTKAELEFIIGGYYVHIAADQFTSPGNTKYAHIVVAGKDSYTDYRDFHLQYIDSEGKIGSNYTNLDTSTVFHGIVFDDNAEMTVTTGTVYTLQVFNSSGKLCEDSYLKFSRESIYGGTDKLDSSKTKSIKELLNVDKLYVTEIRGFDSDGNVSDIKISTQEVATKTGEYKDIKILSGNVLDEEAVNIARTAAANITDSATTRLDETSGMYSRTSGEESITVDGAKEESNNTETITNKISRTNTVANLQIQTETNLINIKKYNETSKAYDDKLKIDLDKQVANLSGIKELDLNSKLKLVSDTYLIDLHDKDGNSYLHLNTNSLTSEKNVNLGTSEKRFGTGYFSKLDVIGDITVSGTNPAITGTQDIKLTAPEIDLVGKTKITGNVDVTENATISGDVSAENATINDFLLVSSCAEIAEGLKVKKIVNATTFTKGFTSKGKVTIQDALDVSGAVNANSVSSTGDISGYGKIKVSKDITTTNGNIDAVNGTVTCRDLEVTNRKKLYMHNIYLAGDISGNYKSSFEYNSKANKVRRDSGDYNISFQFINNDSTEYSGIDGWEKLWQALKVACGNNEINDSTNNDIRRSHEMNSVIPANGYVRDGYWTDGWGSGGNCLVSHIGVKTAPSGSGLTDSKHYLVVWYEIVGANGSGDHWWLEYMNIQVETTKRCDGKELDYSGLKDTVVGIELF